MDRGLDVSAPAGPFIHEQLAMGEGPIGRLLSNRYRGGAVTAIVTAETSRERALDFNSGGIGSPLELELLRQVMARHLSLFLDAESSGLVLFEESLGRVGDPYIERSTSPWFSCDGFIYWFVSAHEAHSAEGCRLLLGAASDYPLIGLLCAESAGVLGSDAVSPKELARLVESVREVVLGAYDAEGYLLWTPSD
jgi:hypothetical protein